MSPLRAFTGISRLKVVAINEHDRFSAQAGCGWVGRGNGGWGGVAKAYEDQKKIIGGQGHDFWIL